MAKSHDSITNPVFGNLRWEPQYSWWFTQVSRPSGELLDVIVEPGDGDRVAFLKQAARLYPRVMKAERRILREAIREELLELYNDVWRQGDEPRLTAHELMDRLQLSLVNLGTVVPVTLSYEAGELFGGHGVAVEVDDELRFEDIDLRG